LISTGDLEAGIDRLDELGMIDTENHHPPGQGLLRRDGLIEGHNLHGPGQPGQHKGASTVDTPDIGEVTCFYAIDRGLTDARKVIASLEEITA
jgi:hypothetical protein